MHTLFYKGNLKAATYLETCSCSGGCNFAVVDSVSLDLALINYAFIGPLFYSFMLMTCAYYNLKVALLFSNMLLNSYNYIAV